MKFTLSKIKKNPQGSNSEGKEAGIQITNLEHKDKKKTFKQNRMKNQEVKKMWRI